MLCRVADDLFWMSRYVERAIAVGRLIDVTLQMGLDAGETDAADSQFWLPLLGQLPGDEQRALDEVSPAKARHYLALADDNPNSLVSCVRRARTAARGVRESISSEMWEQLNTLYLSLVDPNLSLEAEEDPHGFYRRVREGAQFFQGLADSTLAYDEPYHFITLGKYLERADNVARVLNRQAYLLLRPESARGGDELVRWLAVLRSSGSAEAYARYYSVRIEPARVIEFLLLNAIFPQSVSFSLGAAYRALQRIAEPYGASPEGHNPAMRSLGLLHARLSYAAVDEILAAGLRTFLEDLMDRIGVVSDHITTAYLRDAPKPSRLVAAARAALIMAAQQQQQQRGPLTPPPRGYPVPVATGEGSSKPGETSEANAPAEKALKPRAALATISQVPQIGDSPAPVATGAGAGG